MSASIMHSNTSLIERFIVCVIWTDGVPSGSENLSVCIVFFSFSSLYPISGNYSNFNDKTRRPSRYGVSTVS